jgi:small subunit ribosomal protein S4
MARYIGPKVKISRKFNDYIFGSNKSLQKKNYPPGQHGRVRRKKSEYAVQLMEKQKVKYIYGILEKQFLNIFNKSLKKKGVTGNILLQLLESRLDNTIFRLGIASTRRFARQIVSHKHINVNGKIVNIPSYVLKKGDLISIREKSKIKSLFIAKLNNNNKKYSWLEWNSDQMVGKFISLPNREEIPEKINDQSIIELYSK